jgi:hypothetical protein
MYRIILFSGTLAILAAAGATTLSFRTIKPEAVEQLAAPVEPVDPAILTAHLQKLRGDGALP